MIRFLHLTLCNSLHCLLQFHCSTPHILNLHSFYLLHYSFFIHLFSLQLFFLLLSTFCIANKNVKYCLTPSFWLPHLLQSLPCYQTVCLCEQFIFSPFSFKPIYLQKVIWHLSEFIFISRTVGLLWLLISAQFSFQFHLTSLTSFSLNFFSFFVQHGKKKEWESFCLALQLLHYEKSEQENSVNILVNMEKFTSSLPSVRKKLAVKSEGDHWSLPLQVSFYKIFDIETLKVS